MRGTHPRIGVIGAGTMGQALLRGLLAQGMFRHHLIAADPSLPKRRQVARAFGISVTRDNHAIVRSAQVIVLAVKPQQFVDVVDDLRPSCRPTQLIISIAAGIRLRWLESRLPRIPIIRVMPNLPATVGCGFSVMTPGHSARRTHLQRAKAIFQAIGETRVLPERDFDAITAISGSGPAYVFFLMQAWQAAAQSLGLSEEVAQRAVLQTLKGSIRLIEAQRVLPALLIANVASKGGTTEAALRYFASKNLQRHLIEGMRAAAQRSQELSCLFS